MEFCALLQRNSATEVDRYPRFHFYFLQPFLNSTTKQWYGTDVPAWGPGNQWGWYNRNQTQQGNNQQPVWDPEMGMYRNWDDWDRQGWHGMMGSGMMGGTNLYALQNALDFDREFIQQMIPHHQMGVMMASMVLNSSQRPEIRNLAQSIIKSQTGEINQMQQWYQKWYP